jgi:hypothetical protein
MPALKLQQNLRQNPIYGTRSEKLTEDERQLAFEDIKVAQSEAEEQSDTIEMTTPRKKRIPIPTIKRKRSTVFSAGAGINFS